MPKLPSLRKRFKSTTEMWNGLPWKPIAFDSVDLGDFEDSVLLGLEEIDGNAYQLTKTSGGYSVDTVNSNSDELEDAIDGDLKSKTKKELSKKESKKESKKKAKKDKAKLSALAKKGEKETNIIQPIPNETKVWGNIELNSVLYDALVALGYVTPTPIQSAAVPVSISGKVDVVGAAETGSGKTLAFCLPILHFILQQAAKDPAFQLQRNLLSGIIIAPTRELALQISKVLKDICTLFKALCPVAIVSIVGGMSEQKQKRQLGPHSRPPDIIVGTPGRLCELLKDDEIAVFSDLSRYDLVIG